MRPHRRKTPNSTLAPLRLKPFLAAHHAHTQTFDYRLTIDHCTQTNSPTPPPPLEPIHEHIDDTSGNDDSDSDHTDNNSATTSPDHVDSNSVREFAEDGLEDDDSDDTHREHTFEPAVLSDEDGNVLVLVSPEVRGKDHFLYTQVRHQSGIVGNVSDMLWDPGEREYVYEVFYEDGDIEHLTADDIRRCRVHRPRGRGGTRGQGRGRGGSKGDRRGRGGKGGSRGSRD